MALTRTHHHRPGSARLRLCRVELGNAALGANEGMRQTVTKQTQTASKKTQTMKRAAAAAAAATRSFSPQTSSNVSNGHKANRGTTRFQINGAATIKGES
mmetsp:Transcript_61951/g.121677  ORF Transcript_61951/g.121677 Transcript_61951/m.121677 type:complete len:100 (-) Transcript_61951:119-418(-)